MTCSRTSSTSAPTSSTVGWDPEKADPTKRTFEVSLTDDLIDLLGLRHEDLALTNNDRRAMGALDRLFHTYAKATKV
jgi:hypothetical protein